MPALKGYAKEYFHLVKAVPVMVKRLSVLKGDESILEILQDEKEHLQPWLKFAGALGVNREELDS